MLLLSIVFIGVVVVPAFRDVPEAVATALEVATWMIWAVFVFEYAGLLYLAPNRWLMVRTHVLDLLVIALPALRPLRFARALRLMRVLTLVGRISTAIRRINARPGFSGFLAFVIVTVVLGGLTVYSFEHSVDGARIKTAGDGIWWAIATVTTVGYGDFTPVTPEGRAIAVVLMLVGIAMLSVITANVAAYLVQRDEVDDFAAVTDRLDQLENVLVASEIERLVRLRDAGDLSDAEYALCKAKLVSDRHLVEPV